MLVGLGEERAFFVFPLQKKSLLFNPIRTLFFLSLLRARIYTRILAHAPPLLASRRDRAPSLCSAAQKSSRARADAQTTSFDAVAAKIVIDLLVLFLCSARRRPVV